ncbi:hypothetical protein [Stenotrophomonas indicatrix]|uniref:hypothetical protein n=1 Tax=Stenotrophomonas indicatrix TaxID=2045451 RepID=UPI003418424A
MGRQSLLTKSFNISIDELERARYCAKEQGISLNKFLRFAVIEKTRGALQGLEVTDTLNEIRATARESEIRSALALESLMADLRAEQSVAIHENRELVMDTLRAFSQFLAQAEPETTQPAPKPSSRSAAAFLPPKP